MHKLETHHGLSAETPANPTCDAATGSKRVLVMDDEQSILDLTARMLTMQGYDVVMTVDGRAAVDEFRAAHEEGCSFNVVILDLTVPGGMGGLDAFKQMRELDPEVKAIISSGHSHEPILLKYKEHGIAALAPKPYKLSELISTVNDVLKS